jgi:hypothetical protein
MTREQTLGSGTQRGHPARFSLRCAALALFAASFLPIWRAVGVSSWEVVGFFATLWTAVFLLAVNNIPALGLSGQLVAMHSWNLVLGTTIVILAYGLGRVVYRLRWERPSPPPCQSEQGKPNTTREALLSRARILPLVVLMGWATFILLGSSVLPLWTVCRDEAGSISFENGTFWVAIQYLPRNLEQVGVVHCLAYQWHGRNLLFGLLVVLLGPGLGALFVWAIRAPRRGPV